MSTNEMLKINDRIYRSVTMADIPKILTNPGSMKPLVRLDTFYEARLISTNYGMSEKPPEKRLMWLYKNKYNNEYSHDGIENIYLDVTPEKRYAIWDKETQRFYSKDPIFLDRKEAETYIYGSKRYVVVEFDYPGDYNDD